LKKEKKKRKRKERKKNPKDPEAKISKGPRCLEILTGR